MPNARDNGDGTYTITRDDGASFRSPLVPFGVEFPANPAQAAPAAPSNPEGVARKLVADQQQSATVDELMRLSDPGGPTPAQRLIQDMGMGPAPAVQRHTREFSGFHGDPAVVTHTTGHAASATPEELASAKPPTAGGPRLEDFFKQQPGQQQAGEQGGASASASTQQPPQVPSFRPAGAGEGVRELAKAKAMQTAAVAHTAAVAQQHAAAEEAVVDEQLAAAQRRELQARELEEKRARSMEEADGEVREAMAGLQRPTGELDAGRWWSSRTTGQKVSALVASFLSGMVGDADPIQRAQEQDLSIQRDAYERQDKRARARVEGATQLYGMMRQRFQDSELAQRAAEERAAAYAVMEGRKIAASFQGPEAQAMAQERLGQLEQLHAEKREAMRNAAADRAARAYELELKRQDIQADLLAKLSKTGGGHPVPAGEAAQVAGFDAAMARVADLEKAFKEKTGFFSGIAQHLPGTDASKYVDQKKVAAQGVGYIMEGGKLTDSDREMYLDMMPNPGDSVARAAQKFENIRKDIVGRKLSKLEGLGRAGYNVSGFADQMRPASFQAR